MVHPSRPIPIIVLGGFFEDRVEEVVAYGLELALYSMKLAEALASEARRQARVVACHLKLDTGMGRLGLPPERALEEAKRLSDLKGVKLAGIMTHFATADHTDKAFASEQLARFERAVRSVRDAGLEVPCVHAANSAAILSLLVVPCLYMTFKRARAASGGDPGVPIP